MGHLGPHTGLQAVAAVLRRGGDSTLTQEVTTFIAVAYFVVSRRAERVFGTEGTKEIDHCRRRTKAHL